uniref:Phytocyanin domain-containing protein n=1 Tax=Fagus sylvatica TaxID=28930 RepID=A0A2N9HLY7_FAGSY
MAQERGSAIFAIVLILGLLLHYENVWATTFTVGDAGGWTFNVSNWPNGKTFKAGDVLRGSQWVDRFDSLLGLDCQWVEVDFVLNSGLCRRS